MPYELKIVSVCYGYTNVIIMFSGVADCVLSKRATWKS